MDQVRPTRIERTIVIASTFTAEPVRESVRFWLESVRMPGHVGFASQSPLIGTLLDPASPFNLNTDGLNVVLLRWEDLDPTGKSEHERPFSDLVEALRACSAKAKVPSLLITCPASPAVITSVRRQRYEQWDRELAEEFAAHPNISVITSETVQALYPAACVYDSSGDRLAGIPYSPEMFAALGTVISRKFHALTTEPYKVIVTDCDGTLWGGTCGEEGPHGVRVERGHLAMQQFLASQSRQGVLICICSKNNAEDVEAVFRERAELTLLQEHLTARRVNWAPKPENLLSIAEELGLATESFIFLDDDPVECEAMRRVIPEALTLQVPAHHSDIPLWLRRVWAFDRPAATNEDRKRLSHYVQEREREHFRRRFATLEEFLAGLELKVACVPLDAGNMSRASQLTFRVNQFNLTTVRRTEAELVALLREDDFKGFAVEVSDRFGDYGLVGLILYSFQSSALQVDTFLLSCRALGRGVEHQMLAELGVAAKSLGLRAVTVPLIPTGKNQPACDFLEKDLGRYRQRCDGHVEYRVPMDVALAVRYRPGIKKYPPVQPPLPDGVTAPGDETSKISRRSRLAWIASEMVAADKILAAVQAWRQKERPASDASSISPRTEPEHMLVRIWRDVLGLEKIGVRDNFFELGGDSLAMIRVVIQLYDASGVELPVASFYEGPTIEELAVKLADVQRTERSSA